MLTPARPHGGGTTVSAMTNETTAGVKHLHGKYKAFFNEQYHAQVEEWYNHKSSQEARHDFRNLVKLILAFDINSAKQGLRTTYSPDIVTANAIFRQNNGHMFSIEASKKAVEWLSFATVPERNKFRTVFGLIKPPSMFTSKRQYDADFVPSKKFMKSEASFDKGEHIKTIGQEHLHMPSVPLEHDCEIIARHPTHTGTFYVWKTGAARKTNVLQKAHDSTFKGAPWGVYGDGQDSNATQWTTATADDFKDTFFLQNKDERRFQNYNDNYTHMLYRQYRNEKRRRRAEREALASGATLDEIRALEAKHATTDRNKMAIELKVPPPNLACLSSSKYIMFSPIPEMRPKY